jgi:hypothetical protein
MTKEWQEATNEYLKVGILSGLSHTPCSSHSPLTHDAPHRAKSRTR